MRGIQIDYYCICLASATDFVCILDIVIIVRLPKSAHESSYPFWFRLGGGAAESGLRASVFHRRSFGPSDHALSPLPLAITGDGICCNTGRARGRALIQGLGPKGSDESRCLALEMPNRTEVARRLKRRIGKIGPHRATETGQNDFRWTWRVDDTIRRSRCHSASFSRVPTTHTRRGGKLGQGLATRLRDGLVLFSIGNGNCWQHGTVNGPHSLGVLLKEGCKGTW